MKVQAQNPPTNDFNISNFAFGCPDDTFTTPTPPIATRSKINSISLTKEMPPIKNAEKHIHPEDIVNAAIPKVIPAFNHLSD